MHHSKFSSWPYCSSLVRHNLHRMRNEFLSAAKNRGSLEKGKIVEGGGFFSSFAVRLPRSPALESSNPLTRSLPNGTSPHHRRMPHRNSVIGNVPHRSPCVPQVLSPGTMVSRFSIVPFYTAAHLPQTRPVGALTAFFEIYFSIIDSTTIRDSKETLWRHG